MHLGTVCDNRMHGVAQANHDKRLRKRRDRNFMGVRSAPLTRARDGSRDRIIEEVAREASERWGISITARMVTRCWVEYRNRFKSDFGTEWDKS
jgi:hypothetical protein